jgi:mono/diheme cytochrome c family protein
MRKKMYIAAGLVAVVGLNVSLSANAAVPKGDPANGKAIFMEKCAPCHGRQGKGDGPAGKVFNHPKPRNQTDEKYMSTLTDEYIFKVTKDGGASVGKSPNMPPWESILSDDDIWNVIAYLRKDICRCKYKSKN